MLIVIGIFYIFRKYWIFLDRRMFLRDLLFTGFNIFNSRVCFNFVYNLLLWFFLEYKFYEDRGCLLFLFFNIREVSRFTYGLLYVLNKYSLIDLVNGYFGIFFLEILVSVFFMGYWVLFFCWRWDKEKYYLNFV